MGRNWQGRIFAPTLKSTASTGVDYTLGVSAFRMPDTTSANAVDVTSKVASSVLAYNDTGGPATVKLLVRDWGGGGASGVEQSVTIPSGGVSHVVTTGLRTDTGSEELKELRIRAQWATAKASSLFLYSAALGLLK